MGMWDWLEEQYPAPGLRAGTNGLPPPSASDAALLKLIAQGMAAGARIEDDDASAAQAARETGAAALARAVKPPYGRDESRLTKAPEDWARSLLPLPKAGYPAWPSPPAPASPTSIPAAPSDETDEPGEAQAARDAAASTLARAARHPHGQIFRRTAAPSASTEIDQVRQAEAAREAWARQLARGVRRPNVPDLPPISAPVDAEAMRQAQAAREAWAKQLAKGVWRPNLPQDPPPSFADYLERQFGKEDSVEIQHPENPHDWKEMWDVMRKYGPTVWEIIKKLPKGRRPR